MDAFIFIFCYQQTNQQTVMSDLYFHPQTLTCIASVLDLINKYLYMIYSIIYFKVQSATLFSSDAVSIAVLNLEGICRITSSWNFKLRGYFLWLLLRFLLRIYDLKSNAAQLYESYSACTGSKASKSMENLLISVKQQQKQRKNSWSFKRGNLSWKRHSWRN